MSAPRPAAVSAAACAAWGARARSVRLPNGLPVRYVSRRDVLFLYQEVCTQRCYERHGLALPPGGVAIDVGANIGLFSMWAAEQLGPEGRVIACEPLPPTFECLAANVAAHRRWWGQRQQQQHTSAVVAAAGPGGDDRTGSGPAPVLALNLGVGDGSAAEAEFTLYPRAAGWSSMQPAGEEVQAAMAAFLRNAFASRQAAEAAGIDPATAAVGAWLHRVAPGWLNAAAWRAGVAVLLGGAARHRCRLASVSQLIREQGLQRVDFLKVDVERAELEVLRGVEAAHWPLVQQAALEVHTTNLKAAVQLLRQEARFDSVVVEQEAALAGSSVHMVYCRRQRQLRG